MTDPEEILELVLAWSWAVFVAISATTPICIVVAHAVAAFKGFEIPPALNLIAGVSALFFVVYNMIRYDNKH